LSGLLCLWSSWHGAQALLDAPEGGGIPRTRRLDVKQPRFLFNPLVTLARVRMAAQPFWSATTALFLNGAKHVREVARVIPNPGNELGAEYICLALIFPAVLQRPCTETNLASHADNLAKTPTNDAAGDLAFLTWTASALKPVRQLAEEAYEEILGALATQGAVVLQERIFGRAEAARCVLEMRDDVWRRHGAPPTTTPTFVEGVPLGSAELAGIHVIAARGVEGKGRLVVHEGHVCGRVIATEGAEFLALSDAGRLVRGRGALSSDVEARAVLRAVEDLLANEGWTFGDVGRTWFYLREILDWYGPFNRVRNEEFRRMGLLGGSGVLGGRIPASTA